MAVNIIYPNKLLLRLDTTKEFIVHKNNIKLSHELVEPSEEFAFANEKFWKTRNENVIKPKSVRFRVTCDELTFNSENPTNMIGKHKRLSKQKERRENSRKTLVKDKIARTFPSPLMKYQTMNIFSKRNANAT